jgi:hypothetical protein
MFSLSMTSIRAPDCKRIDKLKHIGHCRFCADISDARNCERVAPSRKAVLNSSRVAAVRIEAIDCSIQTFRAREDHCHVLSRL